MASQRHWFRTNNGLSGMKVPKGMSEKWQETPMMTNTHRFSMLRDMVVI
jgi:hypothetical protein